MRVIIYRMVYLQSTKFMTNIIIESGIRILFYKKMNHLEHLGLLARHIIESLKNGSTLFIDEFDGGIHSFVARAILEMFYNASSSAQLVINTHNTSLLSSKDESGKSLLRKDQIYMTNKNRYGESTLMPITEYKNNLRSSIERNYLDGNLTGVPSVDADYLISFVQEDK